MEGARPQAVDKIKIAETASILIQSIEAQIQEIRDGSSYVNCSALKVMGSIGKSPPADEFGSGFFRDDVNNPTCSPTPKQNR